MITIPFQANIFDHLLSTECDGAIIFGRRGGMAFSMTYSDFALNRPELYNNQGVLIRPWEQKCPESISINVNGKNKYIYFVSNTNNTDGCDLTHLAWELVRGLRELSKKGVKKVCFNGARCSLHTTDTMVNKQKADARVNWLDGMLRKYSSKHSERFSEMHLVSLNDVFIRNLGNGLPPE